MKHLIKFLILIVFIAGAYSCDNTSVIVENPEKETTLELVNQVKQDTVMYKVIIQEGILSLDSPTILVFDKDNRLVYKASNTDGEIKSFSLIILVIAGILVIFFIMYKALG